MTPAPTDDASAHTHAGGVVFDDRGRVLVVRPSRPDGDEWTLPKGHIEPGESLEQCALREVAEEARASCELGEPIGDIAYFANGENVRCAYFRMRYLADVPSAEDRERAWFSPPELDDKIRYPDTLRIIRAAASRDGTAIDASCGPENRRA